MGRIQAERGHRVAAKRHGMSLLPVRITEDSRARLEALILARVNTPTCCERRCSGSPRAWD